MIKKISEKIMAWMFAVLFLAGLALPGWAQQTITAVNITPETQSTRVVLSLSGPVKYKMFTLDNPRRVVVDFHDARQAHAAIRLPSDAVVSGVRTAVQARKDLRVVFDLRDAATPSSMVLPPDASSGHRWVLTLRHAARLAGAPPARPSVATQAPAVSPSVSPRSQPVVAATRASPTQSGAQGIGAAPVKHPFVPPTTTRPLEVAMATPVPLGTGKPGSAPPAGKGRDVIVAIDAGHGGQDPGAIGPKGTYEKVVTLAISKALVEELNRQRGVKAKLVRTGDYFIPLKTRRDIARDKLNADLFISIHADAALRRSARGASVFALSRNGATSSLAQMLADRENGADLVGGVLASKDDMVASVIADLAIEGQMEHSSKVGSRVLREMGGVARLHKKQIEKAGFAVLKSAEFPSILVETGFISNPQEESNLVNPGHQRKLARAIMRGVMGYLGDHPPPSTWLAWQRDTKGTVPAIVASPDLPSPVAQTSSQSRSLSVSKPSARAPAKPVSRVASRNSSHRISRGETLAGIASRYDVKLADLRRANAIRNDNIIRIGQVLTIPDT
jgi:N-acetylmuramoyl-L-alanine amidase